MQKFTQNQTTLITRKMVTVSEKPVLKVVHSALSLEPYYKTQVYNLAETIHQAATEYIIQNPRKFNSYHEAVSKADREWMEFKERVWQKDLKGAKAELDDYIIKLVAYRALVDHLIDID